ncbi:MAG: 30S ribosomal protein S12 methylthiotransferase RimO, partial [Planctomycetes bacterium]|nr:30S ribosomal protein S12 methylthiotransferase RimO [Planctomycetota bacterium]
MSKAFSGTVGFISLGCQKNLVDSETMLGRLAEEGYVITADHEHADVVVINTCGFLEASRDESLDTIKRTVKLKANGDVQRVVVAGCMVGKYKDMLLDEVPQVDAMISVNDRETLSALLGDLRTSGELRQRITDPDERGTVYDDRGRFRLTPRHYAYLRISEGCDHTCSFCIIPQIRGKHRSKTPERILEEARELAADGAKELIIIAQDTTFYGLDLYGEKRIASLLRMLTREVDGVEWIRLMYAYPNQVTDTLVETMASEPKILPYIDMPLQHINTNVLKRMRRGGSRGMIEGWIERFRRAIPNFCLRSTFIAGFPGETKEEHQELVEWVKAGWVDRLGCFAYSPERESHSATLDGHLGDGERLDRQQAVMEAAQAALF